MSDRFLAEQIRATTLSIAPERVIPLKIRGENVMPLWLVITLIIVVCAVVVFLLLKAGVQ